MQKRRLVIVGSVLMAMLASACASPTSPTASGGSSTPTGAVLIPAVPAGGGSGTSSPPPRVSAPCAVSQDDVDHARRLLRILTNELQRGVPLSFAIEELPASPRILHGQIRRGPDSGTSTWLQITVLPKTLKFGSADAAGYALWEAAGQLTIVADIYVNGTKVQGCTARTGKITGRIDLDGL